MAHEFEHVHPREVGNYIDGNGSRLNKQRLDFLAKLNNIEDPGPCDAPINIDNYAPAPSDIGRQAVDNVVQLRSKAV